MRNRPSKISESFPAAHHQLVPAPGEKNTTTILTLTGSASSLASSFPTSTSPPYLTTTTSSTATATVAAALGRRSSPQVTYKLHLTYLGEILARIKAFKASWGQIAASGGIARAFEEIEALVRKYIDHTTRAAAGAAAGAAEASTTTATTTGTTTTGTETETDRTSNSHNGH
ncbi:hypothetical protein QBC46DRAFT_459905 [Diplogelasinospora grovesii]|uniref:Uncharacterized protein n=1 Tax=Diplogelasinospora grovesii TaxID=303347 RepID=A0AAN6N6B6_9PEZI|nr:hypothetical protein QBC46DRAFT_459905 [Diplogelasinospora grovesii]